MTADVLEFKKVERTVPCSKCHKPFIKTLVSNEPAFCGYKCGSDAQPEHCITAPAEW